LSNCYTSYLALLAPNALTSIAFFCIATGICGFPHEPAAYIASIFLPRSLIWKKRNTMKRGRTVDRKTTRQTPGVITGTSKFAKRVERSWSSR
ncbi:hypothetical protein BC830DRAFT_1065363, partial [Chytriomyces sp. MP71]